MSFIVAMLLLYVEPEEAFEVSLSEQQHLCAHFDRYPNQTTQMFGEDDPE